MAKKNFGRFLALAAISGAVAAGVSYFLKYSSFHKELDKDFHDFEGEDDDLQSRETESSKRNYVPLGEKKEESPAREASQPLADAASPSGEEGKEAAKGANEPACDAGQAQVAPDGVAASTTIEDDTAEL